MQKKKTDLETQIKHAIDDYRKDQDHFFEQLETLAAQPAPAPVTADQKEEQRLLVKLFQLMPVHDAKGRKHSLKTARAVARSFHKALNDKSLLKTREASPFTDTLERLIAMLEEQGRGR